jgi:hypothetical protein
MAKKDRKLSLAYDGVPFEETRHSVVYERYPMGLSGAYGY